MGRNLVLCADGTGNLGGETPDSNVYRMYNAIDLQSASPVQDTFYDNGVGTSSNKYWRAFSGAFGFGFGQNVRDLYEFLAKNYEPGDNVYLFGFSRGAAEVRALSGFIAACGLVDGRKLEKDALGKRIDEAWAVYSVSKRHPERPEEYRKDQVTQNQASQNESSYHDVISIKFIGVWDTVSALGFPIK